MNRKGKLSRRTKETDINLEIILNSSEECMIESGIPFFDHMLLNMAKHSEMKLFLKAKGDLEVDFHHTVEDIGITMGKVLREALNDFSGIFRYGFFTLPMDETLCSIAIDLCNRPNLNYNIPQMSGKIGNYDVELTKEFFKAIVSNLGATVHINVHYGENKHHITEAIFKCFGKAFKMASTVNAKKSSIPSTKGTIL